MQQNRMKRNIGLIFLSLVVVSTKINNPVRVENFRTNIPAKGRE